MKALEQLKDEDKETLNSNIEIHKFTKLYDKFNTLNL